MVIHALNYINGEWVGADLKEYKVSNPATGELIGTVPNGTKAHIEHAIDSAHVALEEWSSLTANERANYLEKLYSIMINDKEELAKIITLENGKPLKEARVEVDYAASFIKWFAEEGKRVYGRTIPANSPDQRISVIKQPIGVVAAITPWNFPAAMITRKMAPALAAGCTFIVKPPLETPLTCNKIMEYCERAGIPTGAVNAVTCDGPLFGDLIRQSRKVNKLTFTGSTEVGSLLMKQCAETIKNISLELGGQAPMIVFDDADLDKAVTGVLASKFRNAGQTCICGNRFYVQTNIFDKFIEKLKEEVNKLKVGNGLEEQTDIGPLINESGYDKVERHVQDAIEKGAEVVTGGKGEKLLDKAYFYHPTVLKNVDDKMLCMTEETFGPVIPIQRFETDEEVLEYANNSRFGLAGYFFTENVSRGTKIAEKLQCGIIGWNNGAPSTAQAPFGGMKESGLGREGGLEGIEEYLETKYISLGI